MYNWALDSVGNWHKTDRTTALTDASAAIVEAYDTDAYGRTIIYNEDGADNTWFTGDDATTDEPMCEFIFTSRRYDGDSELYYYRARYYSPELGRFLSRDPLGYEDGMSLYEYVRSRPATFLDGLGLGGRDLKWEAAPKIRGPRSVTIQERLGDNTHLRLEYVIMSTKKAGKQARERLAEKREQTWTKGKNGEILCGWEKCGRIEKPGHNHYETIVSVDFLWIRSAGGVPQGNADALTGDTLYSTQYIFSYEKWAKSRRSIYHGQWCDEVCRCKSNKREVSRKRKQIFGTSDIYASRRWRCIKTATKKTMFGTRYYSGREALNTPVADPAGASGPVVNPHLPPPSPPQAPISGK